MGDSRTLVERYLEAWNEEDPAARRAAIEEVWCEDGIYIDPQVAVEGRAGFDATIAAVQRRHPGLRFSLAGEVEARPRLALFCWRHGPQHGDAVAIGFDLAVLTEDGERIRSVHVFLDQPYPDGRAADRRN